MDKGKEKQIRRVFKRLLIKMVKEIKIGWSSDIEDMIINATVAQLLKEVTIRTHVK